MTPSLKYKIDPRHNRSENLSPMFIAILSFLIDEKLTEPTIASLCITSDGFVLAMNQGDIGYNQFIGHERDLWRNLEGWFKTCEIDEATSMVLIQNLQSRIQKY